MSEAVVQATPISRATMANWLDGYAAAWETRSPEAVGRLFSEDARYFVDSFSEPFAGRTSIMEYWAEVSRTQQHVRFRYQILSVVDNVGIAHWSASFERVSSGKQVKLDGVLQIELNAAYQCVVFREWWHSSRKRSG